MKLYEISEQYRLALARIESMDLNDSAMSADDLKQLVVDTVGEIEAEFNAKALAIAAFAANLELEAEAVKTMEKRLADRRKALERKSEWLVEYLHSHMVLLRIGEIKDEQLRLRIRKNPPRVIVDNERLLPEWALRREVVVSVDKKGLAEALKTGENITGAHLETLVLEALVLFGFWGVLAIALVLGVYALMPLLRWLV